MCFITEHIIVKLEKKSMDQEFNFIFKLLRFNSKLRVQYSIGFTLFGTI
ncbi:hypothetical protein LEP1GSC021_4479 [Leptospira noguchii str. 1993005606]|nr:hypothetical protein LEP1GSC074_3528 [Leptospira noguchii str. Hook]EPE83831.1 hypothetical protein LEP1GSC021_4479 [Leptospira noguchii str. 1993005606]